MTDPYVYHIWFAIYHQQKPQMLAYIPYMDPSWDKVISCFTTPSNYSLLTTRKPGVWRPHVMFAVDVEKLTPRIAKISIVRNP